MQEAAVQWVKDFPLEANAWYWRMLAISWDPSRTPEELESAGQKVLDVDAKHPLSFNPMPYTLLVAEVWVRHNVRLQDCVGLLKQAKASMAGQGGTPDDRYPSGAEMQIPLNAGLDQIRLLSTEAELYRKLGNYGESEAVLSRMKAVIADHPKDTKWMLKQWHDGLGALAEAKGQKLDALAHYQQGTLMSPYSTQAAALWTSLGGTTETFTLWSTATRELPKPAAAVSVAPTPAPNRAWDTKDQPLTALKATDLSGRTWTIKDLKGKKTLINVWATWCGPCREELPQVQKLYEQTRDREDLQILTISTDVDPGLIEPFLKAHNYTFPVLLDRQLVESIAPQLSIPRTWIADAQGSLRLEGIGYHVGEWPEQILKKWEGVQ